jgi:hypothetical protein
MALFIARKAVLAPAEAANLEVSSLPLPTTMAPYPFEVVAMICLGSDQMS